MLRSNPEASVYYLVYTSLEVKVHKYREFYERLDALPGIKFGEMLVGASRDESHIVRSFMCQNCCLPWKTGQKTVEDWPHVFVNF